MTQRRSSRAKKCCEEENSEQYIDPAKYQVGRMQPALQIKHEQRGAVSELLNHGRNHHRPQAYRVARDEKEYDLKCKPYADESVVKARMRDRRRILAPDDIEHKIKRRQHQEAPDAGGPKDDLGEFHVIVLATFADKSVRPTQT